LLHAILHLRGMNFITTGVTLERGEGGTGLAQTNIQDEQEAVLVPVHYICDYKNRKHSLLSKSDP